MNDDTVVGHAKATYGLPNSREFLACHLLPEYRALLEEAEEWRTADRVEGYNRVIRHITKERDALKANLDEAMALLTRVHGMFEALDHTHYSDKQFRKWEALNERIAALRERIGK